ncbi:transmembrane protein 11, mitochondrial isoform X2 [Pangasianodon hypophthalmus]|uniref:transmembrane protein 11, mitochondrial isoform X2 n=1 Tax=Pangasianodon hypophthalmus TaxID=310915 RepID=UPI00230752AC|nr:transmembrane protein 11, mitochondrial isoform X2 [Pangasianodon hypophthalmus]
MAQAAQMNVIEINSPIRVEHDKKRRQFSIRLNGSYDRAVLLYEYVGKKTVDLQHTEVPDAYRGRGIAKHLAKAAMDFVVEEDLRAHLTCWYIQKGVMAAAGECYIVHEIYNGENAQEQFEYELEQALEAQYPYIVIEPTRIGDETARWVAVGNCLHKTAVLAGAACLFTPLALPADYSRYVALPAGALSLACAALYGISWQFDPCCKYQVEYDSRKLARLPLHTLTSSTPVVLVRRDDVHRKRLHNTIALAALAYCAKKIYELYAV